VSWLKRLFGTTDAVEDAREQAEREDGDAASTSTNMPSGWASPTTRDEGDAIVLEMPAPGLDPATLVVAPEGPVLHVRANGSSRANEKISLDESLNFPPGSDVSGATASYENDRLVIRVPKAGLKHT
jgi:HSP20 family molecular chaperone IbpA